MERSLTLPASLSVFADRLIAGLRAWYWEAVLLPFIATRLVWILIAWFANYFPTADSFARYVERGGFLTTHHWLDIWTRWDAKWYLSIVNAGYLHATPAFMATHVTNLPFFPLYPYLVKIITVLPIPAHGDAVALVFGVLLSNLCFLAGAGLLYKLIAGYVADAGVAKRTLLLIFAFPTSFIFSCFYPESLFLLLAAACLLLAYQQKWWAAGITGGLLAVTRPQGILILAPLALIYLANAGWKLRNLRWDLAWQALVPLPLAVHFLSLYPITGTPIAPILAQQAYRSAGTLLNNAIYLINLQPALNVWQMDGIVWALFALILLAGAWRLRSAPLALYGLLQLAMPAATGAFFSFTRFAVVIFPIFIMLAMLLKKRSLLAFTLAVLFAFQVLYWMGWVNYFWIS